MVRNFRAGELRRSAAVGTFGPGAIIDMRADGGVVSGIHGGLEEWDKNAPMLGDVKFQVVYEPRLMHKLGKKYFRLAPVYADNDAAESGALTLRRFPGWLQCPKCHRLRQANRWSGDEGSAARYCSACSAKEPGKAKVFTIPVRFIVACVKGHIDDFPWHRKVNHLPTCNERDQLKLESNGPGLSSLYISCGACKSRASMGDVFGPGGMGGLTKCTAKRPWLSKDDDDCNCTLTDKNLRVLQRGASNVYFPAIETALEIPPWSGNIHKIADEYNLWSDLADVVPSQIERAIRTDVTYENLRRAILKAGKTVEEFARDFASLIENLPATVQPQNMRADEFRVLSEYEGEETPEFVIHREQVPSDLDKHFSTLARLTKVREIRVLKGFTRIAPPVGDEESSLAPLSLSQSDWLPAMEIRGEGIFFALSEDRLQKWEKNYSKSTRLKQIQADWRKFWKDKHPDKDIPFEVTPRQLLVHSISHALLLQLSVDAGYNAASLRERLFFEKGGAGVLIYTGTSDSDGTLGGLQALGSSKSFRETIWKLMNHANWCSSDPLCSYGDLSAPESFSYACCHACLMVPETSCETNNMFLDRNTLKLSGSGSDASYFEDITHG
jgi:hypothetical protein